MDQSTFLRKSGLDFIGDLPWSSHLCQFYHQKEDLFESLIPFFRAGLDHNEFCLWILSREDYVNPAKEALAERIRGFESRVRSGQMEITTSEKWYQGCGIETERLISQCGSKIEEALSRRHSGLRIAGGIHRLSSGIWKAFLGYEEVIHRRIAELRMIAICTYSLPNCPLKNIPKVIDRHHKSFLKKGWNWEVVGGRDVA